MKTMLLKGVTVATLALMLCSPKAIADTADIGIGIKGGTLGMGGEVAVGVTSSINARLGYNTFSFNDTAGESDVDYDYDLSLKSIPILIDWHPFEGSGFRMTAGAIINNNEITATGKTSTTFSIGDEEYTLQDVGSLTGKVAFNDVAPFLGIGWGRAVGKNTGLTLALDLGVVFQGSPDVSLNAVGGEKANDPNFLADLKKEEQDLENDIDGFKYYPVLSLGLLYRF